MAAHESLFYLKWREHGERFYRRWWSRKWQHSRWVADHSDTDWGLISRHVHLRVILVRQRSDEHILTLLVVVVLAGKVGNQCMAVSFDYAIGLKVELGRRHQLYTKWCAQCSEELHKKNRHPLPVRITFEIPYGIIPFSNMTVATCETVILSIGAPLDRLLNRLFSSAKSVPVYRLW